MMVNKRRAPEMLKHDICFYMVLGRGMLGICVFYVLLNTLISINIIECRHELCNYYYFLDSSIWANVFSVKII